MSKSKKRRRPKNKKKPVVKEFKKEMIPEVEKDLESLFGIIDEMGKIDFFNKNSDKFADNLLKKSRKLESQIKNKYKGHFNEDEIRSKVPKEYRDHLDSEE
ncbi:MAG: hypothetical protein HN487_00835 [Flavobacterium sp.]|nr:hypothetical protein [Flavobacterium sp.]